MVTQSILDEAVRRLVAAADPLKVILFRSHAHGEATEDSDVDLLVIEGTVADTIAEMVRLRCALRGLPLAVDILVVSEADALNWGHLPGSTLYWALKEGKVLHG